MLQFQRTTTRSPCPLRSLRFTRDVCRRKLYTIAFPRHWMGNRSFRKESVKRWRRRLSSHPLPYSSLAHFKRQNFGAVRVKTMLPCCAPYVETAVSMPDESPCVVDSSRSPVELTTGKNASKIPCTASEEPYGTPAMSPRGQTDQRV